MTIESLFQPIVFKSMAEIIHKFKYQVSTLGEGCVQLDSENVRLSVTYDSKRSYEVCIYFQLQKSEEASYSLKEVYELYQVPDREKCGFFQSTDSNKVTNYLEATNNLLIEYCSPLLQGDEKAFSQLETIQSSEAAKYTAEVEVGSVREQAEEAWNNKRYEDFVNLFKKYEKGLSSKDQRRLVYAEKKIADQ